MKESNCETKVKTKTYVGKKTRGRKKARVVDPCQTRKLACRLRVTLLDDDDDDEEDEAAAEAKEEDEEAGSKPARDTVSCIFC